MKDSNEEREYQKEEKKKGLRCEEKKGGRQKWEIESFVKVEREVEMESKEREGKIR